MNTCASCRHWNHPRTDFRDAVRMVDREGGGTFDERHAEQVEADRQYGLCGTIDLPPERKPGDQLPLAVAKDGSDYMANLYTLPAFGCAMWEPKS